MADVSTIERAIEFVDSIENAVEEAGVDIPNGTMAEKYDEYIGEMVDAAMADVESALDSIIAMQNELIGGDNA